MAEVSMLEFGNFQKAAAKLWPEWLRSQAATAGQNFLSLGMPTKRNEDWKYTDLDFAQKFSGRLAGSNKFSEAFIPFSELNKSESQRWIDLRGELNQWLAESAIENLNLALMTEGAFLCVPKDQKLNVSLTNESPSKDSWFSPRTAIFVEENAELTIFQEDMLGENEMLNSVFDIHLAEGAQLNFIKIQNSHMQSHHISSLRLTQDKNSRFEYYYFALGASVSRDNVYCRLRGEGAECLLKGLAVARVGQHMDQFVFVDHATPQAKSHQLFKSIISNKARSVFNGKVVVREGAAGTDARQLNKNLLLGKQAETDTRPQLEIANDDVKCSHGATIGRLNADEIFYLESRGIPPKKSIDLLCRAFVGEMLALVPERIPRERATELMSQYFGELETDYGY